MRNDTVSRNLDSSSYGMCSSFIVTSNHPNINTLSVKPCDDVDGVAAHDIVESNAAPDAVAPPNPNVSHDRIYI